MTADDIAPVDIESGVDPNAPVPPADEAPSARRASALVGAGILLSRCSGLAREAAISALFGTGIQNDAFRAAIRIPNTLQNLLGEGVLSASFIPVYSRLLAQGDEEEAGRVAGAIAGLLATVAGLLVVLGVLFAEPITMVFASGFRATPERFDLTVRLTRILTPGIGVLVLSAWCLGVLNSHRRFFLSYVAPVLWNVTQIAVLVGLALMGADDTALVVGLAWGVVAGGCLQLAVQVPGVLRLVRHLRLSVRTDLAGVRTAISRFGPAVAGRGVVQISALLDLTLASYLAVGAVSVLAYSQVFYLLPVSLFGMSIAASELPELSRLGPPDAEQLSTWRRRVDDSLARVAFFVVPVAVAYLFFGDLVIGAILRGETDPVDVFVIWITLAASTVGLLATTSGRLLQSTIYALGDTRTPARAAAVRVVLAAVVGVVLMFQLDRVIADGATFDGLRTIADLPAPLAPLADRSPTPGILHLGAVGLALGSGVAAWVELVLLRRRLRPVIGRPKLGGGWLRPIAVAAGAAAVVGLLVRTQLGVLPEFFGSQLVALALVGAPVGVTYLAATALLGVPEARSLTRRLRRLPGVPGRR